jgi:hypothetical protein
MRLPCPRSLAVSLALAAMVLRALLPDGWMPGADAAVSPFVICAADGSHRDGKTPAQPAQERGHGACAFAAAAPLSPPASAAILIAAPRETARLAAARTQDAVLFTAAYRPNTARAPPAFS